MDEDRFKTFELAIYDYDVYFCLYRKTCIECGSKKEFISTILDFTISTASIIAAFEGNVDFSVFKAKSTRLNLYVTCMSELNSR